MKLACKVAVVNGGTSGLGKEIACLLSEENVKVIVLSNRSYFKEKGKNIEFMRCNLNSKDQILDVYAHILEKYASIDILVNNMAIEGPIDKFQNISLEDFKRTIASNLDYVFLCTKIILPSMLEKNRGIIVNISSPAGLKGAKWVIPYATSKAAVIGFSKSLAKEVSGTNLKILCLCPSTMDTNMTRRVKVKLSRLRALIHSNNLPPREVANHIVDVIKKESVGLILIDKNGKLKKVNENY